MFSIFLLLLERVGYYVDGPSGVSGLQLTSYLASGVTAEAFCGDCVLFPGAEHVAFRLEPHAVLTGEVNFYDVLLAAGGAGGAAGGVGGLHCFVLVLFVDVLLKIQYTLST